MRPLTLVKQISVIQVYLLAVGMLLLIVVSTFVTQSREASARQDRSTLIKFSHEFHINEAGVTCQDCHDAASASTKSADNLLSKKANCQTCHEEQLQSDCAYCHTSADQASYVAFENPEREVTFNHELHVTGQSMACETCHQGLDAMTLATEKSLPPMATCNTCHNNLTGSNDCETCHTNFVSLRPKEHDRTNFAGEHKLFARMQDATCMSCHTEESCQDCHVNQDLTQTSLNRMDLVSPRGSRLTANDRAQGMALKQVHNLNFRFTHGVAAAAKSSECATCHDTQDFCSACHMAGGNVNQLQFRPLTHQQAGFATIGVGSGGGLHAQLARRDIESCASCHDTQGADPTCLTCHLDSDGIRNTDPRTHQRGFMADVHGDWHSDPGSSCFVCHADPNARVNGTKGVGFCSYCHQ
jgi:hypothetical protein